MFASSRYALRAQTRNSFTFTKPSIFLQARTLAQPSSTMEKVQNIANRMAGKAANGFQQSEVSESNLENKTAIVTGGSGGIGLEVARALALAKARVIILSRKKDNGEKAIAEIQKSATAEDPVDITFVSCDLGNLKMVKEVADKLRESETRLDMLICSAGVGINTYGETVEGLDRHMTVNHFGHFLLVNRLLPLIRATSRRDDSVSLVPRIVSISSENHRLLPPFVPVNFASIDELKDASIDASSLYARSKLANILFTKYGLYDRVIRPNKDRIIAVATHPGAVHTGQQDQFKEAFGTVPGTMLKYAVIPFMRNAAQGSLSTLWAATNDELEHQGFKDRPVYLAYEGDTDDGKPAIYFNDPGVYGNESSQAKDPELGARLWTLSEEVVKMKVGDDALLPWEK